MIRKVTISDVHWLISIDRKTSELPLPMSDWQTVLDPVKGWSIFVDIHNKSPIGFSLSKESPEYLLLARLSVLPGYDRADLFENLKKSTKKPIIKYLACELECRGLEDMGTWLGANGFTCTSRQPYAFTAYGDKWDANVFELEV